MRYGQARVRGSQLPLAMVLELSNNITFSYLLYLDQPVYLRRYLNKHVTF